MKTLFETNEFCSLCLNVDVKVHKLDTKNAILIENIFKLKAFIPCEDQYICSICLALLSKTSNFIQMIFNAHKLLDNLFKTTDVITKPMLKSIDRHIKGLNPLSVQSFGIFDEDKHMHDFYQNDNNETTNQNKSYAREKGDEGMIYSDNNKTDNNTEDRKNCTEINSSSDDDIKESVTNINLETTIKNCTEINSSSDDDIKESVTNINLETTINPKENDPLDSKKSKFMNNKDVPKKTSDCHKLVPQIESPYSKTEGLNTCETKKQQKRRRKSDSDYKPDSTSHSEDSDFDSYDDKGKPIKIPKDFNRIYPRKCEHCDYQVLKKYDHYRHYQYEHPDLKYPYEIEKNYPCSICGKRKAFHRIKEHESKHTLGQYKCPICPKVFTCMFYVTRHKYRAHRNQIFTCDYCSKSFKSRVEIMRHIRIHTMEKPYKCHICGAGFAHSGNRIIHIRSAHQNIRYVPKKRKQNKTVRRNKKYDSIDTESSGEETSQLVQNKRKISVKRNSKKKIQLETEIKKQPKERIKHAKNKLQPKSTRKESGDVKQSNNRKSKIREVSKCSDDNYTDNLMNSGKRHIQKRKNTGQSIRNSKCDNLIEAGEDSDECLAEMKKKKHESEGIRKS